MSCPLTCCAATLSTWQPLLSQRRCACYQVMLAMKRGQHDGMRLRYAAARAALWFLLDLPAYVESRLFPDHVRAAVRTRLLRSGVWPCHVDLMIAGSQWVQVNNKPDDGIPP